MGLNKDFYGAGVYIAFSLVASLIIFFAFGYPFLQSLRAFLGFAYLIFLPGYVLVRCFFDETDLIEKFALSFGLSIALVILSVMIANMLLRIPLTVASSFLILLVVMIIIILLKKFEAPINDCWCRILGKKKVGLVKKKKK